jgi:catechol 2,3-dioxygenase-like lactoylglutathione lyase family enzyme
MMRASTTVFTVTNVLESAAYYRDKLGFDVAFQYGEPTFYIGLCSGGVTLHLISAAKAPRPPGHGAVSIFVDDVDALHGELVTRGAKVLKEPRTTTMACATSTLPTWTAT